MRELQDWTRAQIAQRCTELNERKQLLERRRQTAETDPVDIEDLRVKLNIDDPSMRESIIEIRRAATLTAISEEHIECTQEQQRLNTELYIRDDPKLVQDLGPGRD